MNTIENLKSFVAETFPHLTEGTIAAMIDLCLKNDGLIYPPVQKPDFLFAFYRYYPSRIEAVKTQDYTLLNLLDLRRGPILYIAGFVAPVNGYKIMRDCVEILNPLAVTFHRQDKRSGEWRFGFVENFQFKPEEGKAHG